MMLDLRAMQFPQESGMFPIPTTTTRHALVETEFGPLTVVRDDAGLAGIYFPGHWTKPKVALFGDRTGVDDVAGVAEQLREYLAGERRAFDLQLSPAPSPRAERMRAALCELPYGSTASYGELARSLGITAREVGALNAHNPISIVVPCHRVIGADGKLVGYAGGLERKQRLLVLEGAMPETPTLW
jgi:methylated-DNA-[protein]-cysteine S-methyltransferase